MIPEYYRRNFVRSERHRVADIVNARMALTGNPVRYDHRSYKAMGLDIEPMQSISRMIADKSKNGKVAILDEKRLKREIELELDRLARARAPAFAGVKAIQAAVRAGERSLRALEKDASHVGGRPIHRNRGAAEPEYVRERAHDYARARWQHLDRAIAADHEIKTIERVIAATEPTTIARWRGDLARRLRRARTSRNPLALERLRNDRQLIPDSVFAQLLQNAAKEHLKERTTALDASAKRAIGRIGQALAAWRRAAAGERRDLNPGVPAHVPRLYGIPHQVKPISPRQKAPTPKAQPWLSSYDFLDSLYTKPLERFATDLFRRFSEFIVENADSSVPGRTPLDLVEKLVTAVKQGPIKVEELITGHRVETPSPPGNRQPLKADSGVLGHGMAPDPAHDSVRDILPVPVAEPTAQSGRMKGGADEILPVGAGTGRIDEVQGRGGEIDRDGQLWQPAGRAAGARPKLDAIDQPAPETASAIQPARETGGPDEDKAASAGRRKRRKKRPVSSPPRRPDGWER